MRSFADVPQVLTRPAADRYGAPDQCLRHRKQYVHSLAICAITHFYLAFVGGVGQAITMSIASKYFAATIPFIVGVFYCIQHFYLRTSRQLRFLDIEHKAPLYATLLEILDGLPTIRAYKWQAKYIEKSLQLLDDSQRPVYLLMSLQQWLIFCVEMVVAVMAVIMVTITMTLREQLSPGLIGIALVNIINFGETMKALIQTWVGLEISIGAVARVNNFKKETKLEAQSDNDDEDNENIGNVADWPREGRIMFDNVTASYP
jgi:ATP-binding cassette subfamily C (CFTR/MRP) protein 1